MRSMVMDYISIPHFATLRQAGTVIFRLKMDATEGCCGSPAHPAYLGPVHRPSSCEQCTRTRLNSRYSVCDSEFVDSCRPYRSSVAKSRYANVCAAVCLVLLVGGLSPQSTAAPHKRMMDRQRRSSQENHLWGNPCDYGSDNKSLKYTAKLAKEVEIQARNALNAASEYKDKFVKLHSFSTYEDLLSTWSGTDWIKSFSWLNQEVKDGLPKQNLQYKQVTQAYVDNLMKNIDSHLPSMFRGLKMVVAGLYLVSTEGLNDDIRSDAELKQNITKTMHNARAVLCLFNDVLRSRGLEIAPLPDSDLPDFKNDKVLYAFLVYRDTLNYLEYLSDVFKHMHMVDLKKTD